MYVYWLSCMCIEHLVVSSYMHNPDQYIVNYYGTRFVDYIIYACKLP